MSHPNHHLSVHKLVKTTNKGKVIDFSAYFVGVVGNFAVVPQIIKAWRGPSPGLAVTTWLLFMAIGTVWLLYAVKHKQRPLIIAQVVGLGFNGLVVLGWLVNNLF